jgi:hypothetical protein
MKNHHALVSHFGRTVSIVFADQTDAQDATLLIRRLMDMAELHNSEFFQVMDTVEESIEDLVRIRSAEQPFRTRLQNQVRPSGVE